MTTPRTKRRVPSFAVEVLRFLVVVFLRRGRLLGRGAARRPEGRAGPGCLRRPVARRHRRLRRRVRRRRHPRPLHPRRGRPRLARDGRPVRRQVLAGAVGAVVGVVVGSVHAWPVFLLRNPGLSLPVFGFVVITAGLTGYRLGLERRDGVLTAVAGRTALRAPVRSPATCRASCDVGGDRRPRARRRARGLPARPDARAAVLGELQALADAGDDLRRAKGRRGLDVLESLKRRPGIELEMLESTCPRSPRSTAS